MYTTMNLEARYYGYYNDCYGNNCSSTWHRWGRWVLLACIIAAFLILFFLFSCLSARRRRKHGHNPYYGTGWTIRHGTPTYNQNAQPQYETSTPYYNNSNNPPPAYSPPPNTTNYGNNIELQQPQAAYNGNYAPPKDPPPGRY